MSDQLMALPAPASEGSGRVLVLQPQAAGTVFMGDRERERRGRPEPGHRRPPVIERVWDTGARASRAEDREWQRRRRPRDLAVLTLLEQHGYLTTADLQRLCWPGQSVEATQQRLRWLRQQRLLLRWWQLLPTIAGWRRLPCVWMLTQLGAARVAQHLGVPPKPVIERSYHVASGHRPVQHDLEVNGFAVELAARLTALPSHGLYHWRSEHAMRRQVQQERELGRAPEAAALAPDAFLRVLSGERQLTLHLEHDRGTEPSSELGVKAKNYLRYGLAGEQVLFVLVNRPRERAVRNMIEHAGAGTQLGSARQVGCWTATTELLEENGILGPVWRGFGAEDGERRGLLELPASPAPDGLDPERALARRDWWQHRPAAGEGI